MLDSELVPFGRQMPVAKLICVDIAGLPLAENTLGYLF